MALAPSRARALLTQHRAPRLFPRPRRPLILLMPARSSQADTEDRLLAMFEQALERMTAVMAPAYQLDGPWVDKLRGALGALLEFLEYEPAIRTLVFVETRHAGPRLAQRRTRALEQAAAIIDQGRDESAPDRKSPASTAPAVLESVLAVIRDWLLRPTPDRQPPTSDWPTYLVEPDPWPMIYLLEPLMSMIVMPYLGPEAAQRELERPVRLGCRPARVIASNGGPAGRPHAGRISG